MIRPSAVHRVYSTWHQSCIKTRGKIDRLVLMRYTHRRRFDFREEGFGEEQFIPEEGICIEGSSEYWKTNWFL